MLFVRSNNMYKPRLLIVTNLYPFPWQPNRATFNHQHFTHLEEHYDVAIIVPVPWLEYFQNRKAIVNTERVRYIPYFYTPVVGRRFHGDFLYHSINISCKKWISSFSPEKLLASWAYPEGMAVKKLANRLGVDYSLKVHGSDINTHIDSPVRGQLISSIAEGAQSILSVSHALKDKMVHHGIEPKKVSVIYNGVDHELFNLPSVEVSAVNRQYLLFIGNLKDTKGVVELMESFAQVSKNHKDLVLIVVGSGPMAEKLREMRNSLKIANRVKFVGTLDHHTMTPLIQSAKAVCLPSYAEGVPNVLLEAMACGTPVVSTNVGGIPEVVHEGINGFLAPAKDSKAFAVAIEKTLKHQWCPIKINETSKKFNWKDNAIASHAAIGHMDLVGASYQFA